MDGVGPEGFTRGTTSKGNDNLIKKNFKKNLKKKKKINK